MARTYQPSTGQDVIDAVQQAIAAGRHLEIRGGGSKASFGAPDRRADLLDMTAFGSVIDYDPAELVLTAGAGAPLSMIQALVASENQMLAFEPFDHGVIYGRPTGAATIGGVLAAGVAGSRRVSAGAARDHLLGFKGVSGQGEAFVAGAKVVKNVTGYDLPKLICGSWGRLVALTEVTLKVLPRGREQATLMVEGLTPAEAHRVMARAMASHADVSAAAHMPTSALGAKPITAIRLEGFGPSVAARSAMLIAMGDADHPMFVAPETEATAFWNNLRDLTALASKATLWRVNVPPSRGCSVVAALESLGAAWLFDWAGGLVWLGVDCDPRLVRAAAAAAGGHATLVKGSVALRAHVPALHPPANAVAALEARVRRAFDPSGVFETGRFLEAARHADEGPARAAGRSGHGRLRGRDPQVRALRLLHRHLPDLCAAWRRAR
jgi:glycolate oxidase FAD binding subunit